MLDVLAVAVIVAGDAGIALIGARNVLRERRTDRP